MLKVLNFLLIPLLIVTHTLIATKANPHWSRLSFIGNLVNRILPLTVKNFPRPFLILTEELKPKNEDAANVAWKKIAIGLLISVPILLVIVPLLSSADMIFKYYITNLTNITESIDIAPVVEQGLIILFVFVYVFSYIWSFYSDSDKPEAAGTPAKAAWDPTILLTVLFVVNLVYLAFSVIQFSYLYGGDRHALPAAFTYAEYARRGFFELVAVTIINLSILLGSIKFINRDNHLHYKAVQCFLSLLVIFSLNMLFSAHFKMSLYEEAYGLTYLRFFVHYFLSLLLVLFLIAFSNIWFSKPPLVKTYIIAAIFFYTVLNFINVDKIIAHSNITRYRQTGKIDLRYLDSLSFDAVPEITKLAGDKNPEIARQVQNFLAAKKQDLLKNETWQSFNYSRYKAKSVL